jgi:short-subunit dehydrogenase
VRLEGARVLLTGASGGIGAAIARALHAKGATLAITGRRAEALEELRAELGERVEVLAADLAKRDDVEALPGRAGRVDVLVANAALPGSGTLDDYTAEHVDRALDVNLRAPMQLTRALLPPMLERRSGHFVFISSVQGKVPVGGASVYTATKFGLRGFAFSLREDLRGSGVGATTVFPGFIRDAGMWADMDLNVKLALTKPPEAVSRAVIRGIESGKAEIDVAPVPYRVGGLLAGAAPGVVSAFTRRFGGEDVARQAAEAQREKR